MACWYRSYLSVIHDIGKTNGHLIDELFVIDVQTYDEPGAERVQGLPKLIDKILWWAGKEAREGRYVNLFEVD